MKTIDWPHQATPGLGTLSSQEPQHTSEMLSLYQIGLPISGSDPLVLGMERKWQEGRERGEVGGREISSILHNWIYQYFPSWFGFHLPKKSFPTPVL